MIYGYARVSTDAQDLGNQLAQLKAAGCEKIFRDKLTGAHAERPQLQTLLRTVTQGDVVLVAAVDRLSRDTTDLLVIARDLEKAGAGLRSLAEPLIDTTSDFKELILAIFGIAAKLERRRIIDRTARGRADAKAKGVKFGRKPKLTPHQKAEAIKRRDKCSGAQSKCGGRAIEGGFRRRFAETEGAPWRTLFETERTLCETDARSKISTHDH